MSEHDVEGLIRSLKLDPYAELKQGKNTVINLLMAVDMILDQVESGSSLRLMRIGDIVKARCSAFGRYIGFNKCIYVSALGGNDIGEDVIASNKIYLPEEVSQPLPSLKTTIEHVSEEFWNSFLDENEIENLSFQYIQNADKADDLKVFYKKRLLVKFPWHLGRDRGGLFGLHKIWEIFEEGRKH